MSGISHHIKFVIEPRKYLNDRRYSMEKIDDMTTEERILYWRMIMEEYEESGLQRIDYSKYHIFHDIFDDEGFGDL